MSIRTFFSDELPGLPPHRDVDFTIELHPNISSISMTPHRIEPAELQELKVQLQELLDESFIRPSTSPLGMWYRLLVYPWTRRRLRQL